jgi:hypothetical protein
MKKALLTLATVAISLGNIFDASVGITQESPTTRKPASVRITEGPEMERVDPDFAIVRWTSNNPGGSPVHDGIVRYGTDPANLSQMASSPIRLNPAHACTVFRVRIDRLKPRTKYYYTVESRGANGEDDRVKSAVKHFATP